MQTVLSIRCPNCGSMAERHYLDGANLTRTQCSHCDYLMIMCSVTGKVIEAYAPGLRSPIKYAPMKSVSAE
jgi:ribosomal protein S27AE